MQASTLITRSVKFLFLLNVIDGNERWETTLERITDKYYVKVDNCVFNRSNRFAPGVGENLHNHASYTLSWTINQPNLYDLTWASATEYIAFQKGPMSSTGLSQLTGMLPSIYTTADHPDIQIFFGGYQAACATTGEVGATMNSNGRSISMSPTMTHPRSKGKRN